LIVFDDATLFKRIVDLGSLAKAAESLGISASAVSKHLVRLEKALNVQLLKRTTRRQYLTEAGLIFYQRLHTIESDWLSSLDEVRNVHAQPQGQLTIATPQPIASRFLMPMLAAFQQCYPKIQLTILNRTLESLPCSQADISISRELENYHSAIMVAVPFYEYHNSLYASPKFIQTHGPLHSIEDLSRMPCVTYGTLGHNPIWHFYKETQQVASVTPQIMCQTDNTEVLISAAVNHIGIAYLPAAIIEQELNSNRLIAVLPELQSQTYKTVAYYPKMEFMPRKTRLFLDMLKTFYR